MKSNDQVYQSFGMKTSTGHTMGEKSVTVSSKKRYSQPSKSDITENVNMSIHTPVNISTHKSKHKKSYLEK